MKKLLLILGMTNFIAIETSLIISCSDKLTKPIERPKQATNPSQCGKSCELEFAEILNSSFVNTSVSNYLTGWLQINSVKNQLPSDTGYSDFYIVYNDGNGNIISSVFDFYKKNGVLKNKTYSIDKIVNVKITIARSNFDNFWIASFSAEMPSLPQKDNEQPLPIEQPKPRADHLKI